MQNNQLYQFLLEKTWQLTEQWYESLDKTTVSGVYASTDPEVVKKLKEQNYEFHVRFCKIFAAESSLADFEEWIVAIAKDDEHSDTPVHFILGEFFKTEQQYLDLIKEFYQLHEGEYSTDDVIVWTQLIVKTFGDVMTWFTEEHHNHVITKLNAQQALIHEISSPVISLGEDSALLPLVGDIDTARAQLILEKTLEQCNNKNVGQLYIDLSGVIVIDTMVAHQIFKLLDSLKLIGVKTTLSGIRPEIAQTAVQLGLSFKEISITPTLDKAINLK